MTEKVLIQDTADMTIYHREVNKNDIYQTVCGRKISFTQYTVRVPEEMGERLGQPCPKCYSEID